MDQHFMNGIAGRDIQGCSCGFPCTTAEEWREHFAVVCAGNFVQIPRFVPARAGRSVLQDWTNDLTFMMQSVLICAVRGPDGIRKDHPVKVLCRYLRRSFMICAFDGKTRWSPYEQGGGSFTGPLHLNHGTHQDPREPTGQIDGFVGTYLRHVDELPHHFQLHLMHAAEILGYKHPDPDVNGFWRAFYLAIVKDAHLRPETEETMDHRLGDVETQWRAAEVVTAQ